MATVTLSVVATQLIANAAAVAASAAGGITTANIQALGQMLQIMADKKGLGLPPMLYITPALINELTPA